MPFITTSIGGGSGQGSALNYSQQAGQSTTVSDVGAVINGVEMMTTGKPVQISVTGEAANDTAGSWIIVQLMDGPNPIGNAIQLEASAVSENVPFALNFIHTAEAGGHDFHLKVIDKSPGSWLFGEAGGSVFNAVELTGLKGDTGESGSGSVDLSQYVTFLGTETLENKILKSPTFTNGGLDPILTIGDVGGSPTALVNNIIAFADTDGLSRAQQGIQAGTNVFLSGSEQTYAIFSQNSGINLIPDINNGVEKVYIGGAGLPGDVVATIGDLKNIKTEIAYPTPGLFFTPDDNGKTFILSYDEDFANIQCGTLSGWTTDQIGWKITVIRNQYAGANIMSNNFGKIVSSVSHNGLGNSWLRTKYSSATIIFTGVIDSIPQFIAYGDLATVVNS